MKIKILILAIFLVMFFSFWNIKTIVADTCTSNGGTCVEREGVGLTPACPAHTDISSAYSCDSETTYGAICCTEDNDAQDAANTNDGSKCAKAGGTCEVNPCAVRNAAPNDCPSGVQYCCAGVENTTGNGTDTNGTGTGGKDTGGFPSGPGTDAGTGAKTGGYTNISQELSLIQSTFGLSGASIKQILSNLLSWMLTIIGIIGIIAFIISGVQYLISAGDEDMIERAKLHMKWSIVGVIIALGGFVILNAINILLQGNSWNF
ncbi:MAG: pilin [Candidatus Moranbacteria bacterium]|nr:pilin [Candidatus Moranbacteria bacterium]